MSKITNLSNLHAAAFRALEIMATPAGKKTKLLSEAQSENLKMLENATENTLTTINGGLRGIGQMMTTMAEQCDNVKSDLDDTFDKMSRMTMIDIGTLVAELAETADCLMHQKNEIEYIKRQQAKI